jgi:hypothetical protein
MPKPGTYFIHDRITFNKSVLREVFIKFTFIIYYKII